MTQQLIKNTATLNHALAHHAHNLEPLVGALALGILLELQPHGWKLRQSRTGAQSFALLRGPHEFHFRAGQGNESIVVRDRYTNGKVVFELASRRDVLAFVRHVRQL